nr:MAG TPA: hypothetical protein [Caudoviricetes sp.]
MFREHWLQLTGLHSSERGRSSTTFRLCRSPFRADFQGRQCLFPCSYIVLLDVNANP